MVPVGLVWFIFFIHSFAHVTLDTSITDYNLYVTTQLLWTSIQYNIITTKFKDQLEVESVTTTRYMNLYKYN
jgi:hypothetical protein